jgi:hypothetical protein
MPPRSTVLAAPAGDSPAGILEYRPHTLYRFFDRSGRLLYIGITVAAAARWGQHSWDKSWWNEVATCTIQHFPRRSTALAAERAAIRSEKPLHNVQHNNTQATETQEQTLAAVMGIRAEAFMVIRCTEITRVPRLLQVEEYARRISTENSMFRQFDPAMVEPLVEERMREQEILNDPRRRFEFIIGEAVLHYTYAPHTQLARFRDVAEGRPNLRFGIIPFDRPLSIAPQSFTLLDDLVVVEHYTGERYYHGEHAARGARVMDHLWRDAVTGEDARRLIVAAADSLPRVS